MKNLAAVALCATLVTGVHGQTGIRFIVPEYTKKFLKGPSKGLEFGIGLDHDLTDRLSMGVDMVFDITSVQRSQDRYGDDELVIVSGPYTGYYTHGERMLAFTYRTSYDFSDGLSRPYIGTFIGVRNIKQQVDLGYWDGASNYGDQGPFAQSAHASRTVVPVGIRSGLRMGTIGDGYHGDIYIEAGYCLGGGVSGFTQSYLQEADGLALAKFTFSAGFAIGFGW